MGEILVQDFSEVGLRRSGRRPVVVRQIEMRDPEIERAKDHLPAAAERIHSAKILPEAQ